MDYEPVALQAGKVRSHSVVGQAQLFCEFVYRPILVYAKSSRILPRVLLNNRSRQPICFIKLKIMDVRRKSKDCLTNSRLAVCLAVCIRPDGLTSCS